MEVPIRHLRLIEALEAMGFIAKYREWAMGQTIQVAHSVDTIDEIQVLNRVVSLEPAGDDSWVMQMGVIGGRSDSDPIAEEDLCGELKRILATDESYHRAQRFWVAEHRYRTKTARRCPQCNGLFPDEQSKCRICDDR